jgi:hypothetical protein
MYLFKYVYNYDGTIRTRKEIYRQEENGKLILVSECTPLDPTKLIDVNYEEI